MSDFAQMMEKAAYYEGLVQKLVPLAEQIAPAVQAAEPAVEELVNLLFAHRDSVKAATA
jgi:hypothetical protein